MQQTSPFGQSTVLRVRLGGHESIHSPPWWIQWVLNSSLTVTINNVSFKRETFVKKKTERFKSATSRIADFTAAQKEESLTFLTYDDTVIIQSIIQLSLNWSITFYRLVTVFKN